MKCTADDQDFVWLMPAFVNLADAAAHVGFADQVLVALLQVPQLAQAAAKLEDGTAVRLGVEYFLQAVAKQKEGQAGVTALLQTYLVDEDPAKRVAAVTALGDLGKGNEQYMAALKKALSDPSPAVRNAAKQSLEKIEKESRKK